MEVCADRHQGLIGCGCLINIEKQDFFKAGLKNS